MSGVLNTMTDTVSASMKSFTDFLQNGAAKLADATGVVGDYVHPAALIFLYVILFVHFVAWALENNDNLQKKWPAFAQSMHELRNFIQRFVLGSNNDFNSGLIYWGSFAMSATVTASTSSITEDVQYAMYVAVFYAFVWIVNQVCMALTMTEDSTTGALDGGPFTFVAGSYIKAPLLEAHKGRPFWIIVTWLQSVTALVLFNSIRGLTYGYGAGKLVGLIMGNESF